MPEQTAPATATILEKVMSKYTVEQVEDYAQACALIHKGPVIAEMLRGYAALLRERESAKAVVTDEVIQLAIVTAEKSSNATRIGWDTMRAALEAVAPTPASARVPDASWFEGIVCEARNKWAEQCEADWLETDNNHPDEWMGKYIRDALLAAAPKPETEE